MSWEIRQGEALERLREMPDESVQCCVTSPPYWNLRDYGTGEWDGGDPACTHLAGIPRPDHSGPAHIGRGRQASSIASTPPMRATCTRCGAARVDRQLGLEDTPDEYVADLVEVLSEVRRVLRADGTLWLNIGDTYANRANSAARISSRHDRAEVIPPRRNSVGNGIKAKDLIGVPWMVAFAARAEGWWLRSEVIWHKPNGLPGGGIRTTKPDRFHEHIFLLAKSANYFYDAEAIAEPITPEQLEHNKRYEKHYAAHSARSVQNGQPGNVNNDGIHSRRGGDRRTKRSVWKIATVPFADAHFATFPPKLVEPCILAGTAPGDTVLDPFAGAATTGLVATRLERDFIGIELSPTYCELGRERIRNDAPLLNIPSEIAA